MIREKKSEITTTITRVRARFRLRRRNRSNYFLVPEKLLSCTFCWGSLHLPANVIRRRPARPFR